MSNGVGTFRRLALAGLLAIQLSALLALDLKSPRADASPPPLWGDLRPGPHAVGFKTLWQLDYSRRYNITFDDKTTYAPGKAPRPILVNLWYPASQVGQPKRMTHRAYLNIRSDDPRLTKFSTKLAAYNRAVIAAEVMGKPAKELTDREKVLLDQFLDTPTACIRNAVPAEGKFPLVIYHAGHGSSFEDNAVLCEFLASHGYVVCGSAFQKPDGSSFGVDGLQTSARDMEFLAAYARQLPAVDWHHIGAIGHSGGAHAALMYRAHSNCVADAVVSLDTTQDYYSVADPRWRELTTTVVKNRKNMVGPLLMVANPHAFFEMADSLSLARRTYLTIRDLDHNDFISQGGIGRELRYRVRFPGPARTLPASLVAAEAKEKARLRAVKASYESLCVYVLHFLDAELKGASAGKEFLATQYRDTKLGDAAPHVELVPVGRTGPKPYRESSSLPPTPGQLRAILRAQGREKTVAVLRRCRKETPTAPIYHVLVGLALVIDLLDQGKTREAVALRDYYRESGVDYGKFLLAMGKHYLGWGRKSTAAYWLKRVLLLEPSNGEAAAKLKEFSAGKKNGGAP